jgi:hypothetical protein
MQTKEKQAPLHDLQNELNDLKIRAAKVGYKNNFPKLPRATRKMSDRFGGNNLPPDHLMLGFYKRLGNWTSGLIQLEFPGGIVTEKPVEKIVDSSLEQLVSKFEN